MREMGRWETGQHIAIQAVGRAVHLFSFALRQAAESGVPLDRLVELTGWESELVSEALAQAPNPMRPPAASFVARLAPPELDAGAVSHSSAPGAEATQRV